MPAGSAVPAGQPQPDLGLGLLAMLETPEQAREAAAYLYHQTDDRMDGAGIQPMPHRISPKMCPYCNICRRNFRK